ncbi:MAG TPA: TraR/DksA C4-type zinc finger protein [Acidimicrobiales bacterium]|jgi:RNA polymerase-binding transcription factor DksA
MEPVPEPDVEVEVEMGDSVVADGEVAEEIAVLAAVEVDGAVVVDVAEVLTEVEVDEVGEDRAAEPDDAGGGADAGGDGAIGIGYDALLAAAEHVLDDVDGALARLQDGTYGRCEVCDDGIADERLVAEPTARTCERHLPLAHAS